MTFSTNRFLTRAEMTVNAQYLMNAFTDRGWTKNAVAGMLGNMETESTINPGLWQNRDEENWRLGFGLVQWTPSTNYIDWALKAGYDRGDIEGQILRIVFEKDNGLQWIQTTAYPITFKQFASSKESPEYLAQAFLRNYERPANQNQPLRSTQARHWFDALDGEGGGGGKPFFPARDPSFISSEYGMRWGRPHTGMDIGGGGQTHPIWATQTGEVIYNGWTEWGGWGIRIKHIGDPYFSMYIHLESQSPISVGANVTKGQTIGTMGNTGDSQGIHLHFEIMTRANGYSTFEGTIDPRIYLDMDFGGGGVEIKDSSESDLLSLLLCGAMSGW